MPNPKKTKSLLTPNWTSMDTKSDPFYQPASGSFSERYSVTVLSKYATTGGPELQKRMDACKEPGLTRILKYYSKTLSGSIADHVFAEDYYISERPKAKMKVLVSLPCSSLETLPNQVAQTQLQNLGPPTAEINLNSQQLDTKIQVATNMLSRYKAEIEQFYGRIYDIDFDLEITRLKAFLPTLTTFLRENNIIYSSANSDLITLYINDQYKVLMTKINQGKGYVDLIKGYNNFIENPSINNDRTIFFLSKLNEMERVSIQNKTLSWSKFLNDYVYRPPSIDFSKPPPKSYWKEKPIHTKIYKQGAKLVQTKGEKERFREYLDTPAVRKELQQEMEDAHAFIGDTVLANLDQLSSLMKDMEAIYDNFFNKLGLDGLINSAVQCLDLPEIGIFKIPTELLDTLTAATKVIQNIFNPPTMSFPSNFPVVDFMGDMIVKMLWAVLDALISMLISMIIEIIKSLFDFCNECAVSGDNKGNKKLSKLAFGQSSFLGLIGKAMVAGTAAGSTKLLLGSFYNSIQETVDGDVELLAQEVLKNSIKDREHIYKLEAKEIFRRYQSGELGKSHRLALDKKIEEMFGVGLAPTSENLMNIAEADIADLWGSTNVTEERIAILLKTEEPWETGVFKDAAEEVAKYLEMSSAVLNPGEIGNVLMGCNVGDEAKEVMRNTAKEFPDIYKILGGPDADDEKIDNNIAGLWSGFSSIIPQRSIIEEVTNAINSTPEKYQCLCDVDDTALRNDLLRNKDPQMTPEQRREQVTKSKARKLNRLKEMAGMMGKDDILAGLLPPLVCSGSYDDSGNPVIEQGILPTSHPVTQFMIKQSLDTIYDSLHITFTRDLKGLLPAMSQKPLNKRVVPRTVMAEVDGDEIRTFNMEFLQMVGDGMVSYGSLPAGSIVPGSRQPATSKNADREKEEDEKKRLYKGTEIKEYNWFLTALGFDDWENPQGAGLWEEGQTKPTAEQEYDWEMKNVTMSASYDNGRLVSLTPTGGRRFDDTLPSRVGIGYKWNIDEDESGDDEAEWKCTMADYAKSFGYSPIPIETYSFGELTYAPGLKQSYTDLCKNLYLKISGRPEGVSGGPLGAEFSSQIFMIKETQNSTNYKFKLPNIMNSFGIEFDKMSQGLSKVGGDIMKFRGPAGGEFDVDRGRLQWITEQLETIAASHFNLIYDAKHDDGTSDLQKDRFSLDFQIMPPPGAANTIATSLTKEMSLTGPPSEISINPEAAQTIERKNLEVARPPTTIVIRSETSTQTGVTGPKANASVQPQEGYFYDFAKESWLNGNTIYRDGEAVQQTSPTDTPPSLMTGFLRGENTDDFLTFLYSQYTYKNAFEDLFCAFTNQISKSPYLNLRPDDEGRGLLNLNLTPAKIVGNDPLCYRTLLDVDLIKRRILEEYEYVKCFKEAFEGDWSGDTTGLTGNKDTAFEISNRAGCVLLTIRLYVIEFLLRSIYTFHYFVLGKGADADATSVYYLYHQIKDGLERRSIGTLYYEEFQRETVELYNRNNDGDPLLDENKNLRIDPTGNPKYTDFNIAMEYFIRNQLYSVSRRLSKHVRLKGDGSPHSILLEKWLPTVEPPRFNREPRFAEQVENSNGTIELRNKPLGPYLEAVEIAEIGQEIADSVAPGGTLTEKRISFIRGQPGTGSAGNWGMLYQSQVGTFFREYFKPDARIEAVRKLIPVKKPTSAMFKKAQEMANWLWSPSIGITPQIFERSPQKGNFASGEGGYYWSFREAIMLGFNNEVYANNSYQQLYGKPQEITIGDRMGLLGFMGFPYNRDAVAAAEVEDYTPVRPEKSIQNYAFPFGVSEAEKEGMIGDKGDIPGGLLRFIEAAKNWTMGPIRLYDPADSGLWPEGGFIAPPDSPTENGQLGKPRTTPNEYVIWEPDFTPWWWEGRQLTDQDSSNPHRINYVQSAKFYGPGSLLWAMSREREPSNDAFGLYTGGAAAHGVGAFGIINDYQQMIEDPRDAWPDEYVDGMGDYWKTDPAGKWFGQWWTINFGPHPIGQRLPFLVDWHNYVLGKKGWTMDAGGIIGGSRPPPSDGPDYTRSPGSERTKNVEITLRKLRMGMIPYISLMDLDVSSIIKTLEWEQIQYNNFADDLDMFDQERQEYGALPPNYPDTDLGFLVTLPWKSYSLKVLVKNASFAPKEISSVPAQQTIISFVRPFRIGKGREYINFYRRIALKYDGWIDEMGKIKERFEEAEQQRTCMMEPVKNMIAGGRMERNDMEVPSTLDISNGNFILEPYIRVEDYDVSQVPELEPHIDYVKGRGAFEDGVRPSLSKAEENLVPEAHNILAGVVNIDLWDEYMKAAFGPDSDFKTKIDIIKPALPVTDAGIDSEECGDELVDSVGGSIMSPGDYRDVFNDLGEGFASSPGDAGITPLPAKHQLRDFFKSFHFGLRISYLAQPGTWTYPNSLHGDQKSFAQGVSGRTTGVLNSEKEKTYVMAEELSERLLGGSMTENPNDVVRARNLYLTPLTAVEIPINMFTNIDDLFPAGGFKVLTPGDLAKGLCGGPAPPQSSPDDVEKEIGYFRYKFATEKKNKDGDVIALSSPRNALQIQLEQTDEYAFLFKYAFSLDRMLSLTNLYSATYLATLPDINNLFAPTKENLMYIFLNSLNSGRWADACQTGNKDLLDALLNGIDVPWAALIAMVLKFPLKIFKAFMEQSDINIAISKNIQRAIKMLNAIIATAQRQMNAMQQAGAAAYEAGKQLAGTRVVAEDCGFGIHSPESTKKPPNEWFKEVDETFLYEPETYQIGLALLPATIFAPWLWGPPITLPHGIAYWALDHSSVNWLDAIIDDWISDMQKKGDNLEDEIDGPCEIDYGLEFGLAAEASKQKMLDAPPGSTGGNGNKGGNGNGGGGDGGSSY